MEIVRDDLTHPKVLELLKEHLAGMHANSPEGCVQAFDFSGLKAPGVTFWTAWDGEELLGCGALNELDATHGEIKSMRTATAHLRRGVGGEILAFILREAQERGHTRVSLETGSSEGFRPAHALYERFGFVRCGPFGDYEPNGFSVFMTREIK